MLLNIYFNVFVFEHIYPLELRNQKSVFLFFLARFQREDSRSELWKFRVFSYLSSFPTPFHPSGCRRDKNEAAQDVWNSFCSLCSWKRQLTRAGFKPLDLIISHNFTPAFIHGPDFFFTLITLTIFYSIQYLMHNYNSNNYHHHDYSNTLISLLLSTKVTF